LTIQAPLLRSKTVTEGGAVQREKIAQERKSQKRWRSIFKNFQMQGGWRGRVPAVYSVYRRKEK